ncbi:glycosyltransferase family 2 protein [Candidatus Margulisiibacteriota bacterium]
MPKVSVIMAAHNHAHFLPRSIGSVKSQTYRDYELIVVDNGSTDDTKSVIEELSWDKLRYISQEDTGSVAGPRNTGLKAAKGEYVAFLDSDDNWIPDKLEKVMKILEDNPQLDVLTHDMIRRTKDKVLNRIFVGPKKKGTVLDRLLFDGNFILGSATVVKREAMLEVGGFDGRPEFVHAEDYETWLRLAEAGKQFFFFNEALGDLYVHESNLSGDIKRATDDLRNVINYHFRKTYAGSGWWWEMKFRRALAQTYFIEGRNWQQKGSYLATCWFYLKSILTYPFIFKTYIFLAIALLRLEKTLERLKIYTIRV